MRYIAALYITVIIGIICVFNYIPHYVPPPVPLGRDEHLWNKGRAMYSYKCIACHNANPSLPGSNGPAIRGVSEQQILSVFSKGGTHYKVIPAYKSLAKALEEYLR